MKASVAVVAVAGLALIGFLAQLGARDESPAPIYALAGAVLIIGVIVTLAVLARQETEDKAKGRYFVAIGTLIGAILGIAGGTAVGAQAGQDAATATVLQLQSQPGASPAPR